MVFANHGHQTKRHDATEHTCRHIRTTRMVTEVFAENFFLTVRRIEPSLNHHQRNRQPSLLDASYLMESIHLLLVDSYNCASAESTLLALSVIYAHELLSGNSPLGLFAGTQRFCSSETSNSDRDNSILFLGDPLCLGIAQERRTADIVESSERFVLQGIGSLSQTVHAFRI